MVKKLQKMAEKKAASAAGLLDSQLAQTVKDSAQQIWLAGLGAFAKAQGEGNKVFETLMKEGLNLHRMTQSSAGEKLGDVAGRMSAMAGQVGSQANAQWDKLESIFEERTARALGRLGVPTAKDVQALADRVDALTAAVAQLSAATAPATARPAAKKIGGRVRAAAQPARAEPAAAPAKKARARKAAAKA
jgi:poly(hydroxyalkanoate) granule-associated protein